MIIWLLALLLVASVAALGFRQGVIRVGFSFFGILAGAVLAVPLGRLMGKLLGTFGLKDPVLLWVLGPILIFIIVSAAFKIGGTAMHHKVDVYYKYHGGDLRLALWERLQHRLGACLGVFNGVAYAVLLSLVIYLPGHLATPFATSDSDPRWLRWSASLGSDLHNSGFDKVAASIDSVPQVDYDMVDFAALLYRNSLLEARLGNYPAFLGLAERPEFQGLASDKTFTEAWQRQDPIMTLLDTGYAQSIRNNPELLKEIWKTVAQNLTDARTYLKTGHSAKYDEIKILGRWQFDVNAAVMSLRRAKPNIPSSEMLKVRRLMEVAFSKATLVARPDNQVAIKDIPGLRLPAPGAANLQTMQGQWKDADGKYQLAISGMDLPTTVEGDRLTIKGEGMDLVFSKED